MSSLMDTMAVGINDVHSCLGENNRVAKVSKEAKADEGMGEGGHHMALHSCRRKKWDQRKGCTSNRPLWEAVGHADANGGSLWVEICNGSARRKVESTGTRVSNASVGRWYMGGIVARRYG